MRLAAWRKQGDDWGQSQEEHSILKDEAKVKVEGANSLRGMRTVGSQELRGKVSRTCPQ